MENFGAAEGGRGGVLHYTICRPAGSGLGRRSQPEVGLQPLPRLVFLTHNLYMRSMRNMEAAMSRIHGFLMAAMAVLFIPAGVCAGDKVLLALNSAPVQTAAVKTAALLPPATAQAPVADIGTSDYDAFSAVNDPLYREGSKEFLQQVSAQDAVKPEPGKAQAPVLRDAPADGAVPAVVPARKPVIKKLKTKKPVHADPLKVKDTL